MREVKGTNITVLLHVESRYKVNRKRIRLAAVKLLQEQNVVGPVEVSIAIVGERKMRALSRQFKGDDKSRNILSFPLNEGPTMYLPEDKLRLGDIVISYPILIKESAQNNTLVDDRMDFLVVHGMKHLLGLHHE